MLRKRKLALVLMVAIMMVTLLMVAVGCSRDEEKPGPMVYNITIKNINPLDPLSKLETKCVDGKLEFNNDTTAVGLEYDGLYSLDGAQYYDAAGVAILRVNSNMILTCKWIPKKYGIEFMNGGASLKKATFTYNSTGNIAPKVSTNVGYECAGWATSAEPTKKILISENMALDFNIINFPDFDFTKVNTRVYPVIEKQKLSVSFAYGGSDIEKVGVRYGDSLPKAPVREYPNKRIVGWTTIEGGYDQYTDVITSNITLYPIFADLRTLTFDTRGGDALTPIRAIDGETITLPTAVRLYYNFLGWSDTISPNAAALPKEHIINGDMTFYAKWNLVTYTLKFNTLAETPSPNSVKYTFESEKFTLPSLANEAHRTFEGWSLDKSDRVNILTVLDPKKNCGILEIFAVWKGEDVNVTMNSEGVSSTVIIEYGADFTLPVVTSVGYVFDGWSTPSSATPLTDKTGKCLAPWTGANDIQAYPIWLKLYSLTFDTGSDIVIDGAQLLRGDTTALRTLDKRYKYDIFLGWSYKGVVYKDIFTMLEEDVKLTATWDTQGFKYIHNGADFWGIDAELNTNDKGKYMLTCDIDLSVYNWDGIGARGTDFKTFGGVIDGDGHSITGFKSIRTMKRNNPGDMNFAFWGLFIKAAGATFKDFTLANAEINLYQDGDKGDYQYLLGGVAGRADDTIFENITVSGNVMAAHVDDGGKDWKGTCYTYVGGLVGYGANSQFINCQNSARVVSYGGDSNAGGIAGGGQGGLLFKNCTNSGAIRSRGSWQKGCTAFSGGIMGFYTQREDGKFLSFENSSNSGALETFGGVFTEKKSHPILAAPIAERP